MDFEISAAQVKAMQKRGEKFVLLDVREPWEIEKARNSARGDEKIGVDIVLRYFPRVDKTVEDRARHSGIVPRLLIEVAHPPRTQRILLKLPLPG